MGSDREQTLRTLHEAAMDIRGCESVEAACERTVEAAEDVLQFEMCSLMVHSDGWLEPVAASANAPTDGVRRMADDQGLAGKTYQTGESYVVDEVAPEDETDPAKASYRSGMSVPVGDAGVFQAVSTEPAAFDDADVEFAELLVAHTAGTIDRIQFQSELRRSKATLQRQNERLEKFVNVISHDLRNPLTVATGQLELAKQTCDSDRLDAVERAHDRMSVLIDELLTIAREGRPVDNVERVALDVLVEDCWEHVATGDATIRTETDRTIRAESSRLKQLLENLFRNSVEHGGTMPPTHRRGKDEPLVRGGQSSPDLTVTVGDLPDGFYVEDDGPGIPEEERDEVFDAGYTTSEDGTGLGLNIVKEIADAHGWSVGVTESRSGGARFEVTGVDVE